MVSATTRGRLLARLAASALLVGAAGSCKLDEASVPQSKPEIVVHAVLNPVTAEEVVLLEQTLTGEVSVPDRTPADSLEPILSGGGVPITDATVQIRRVNADNTPASGWATGIQDAAVRPDGRGRGVYRFADMEPPMLDPKGNEVNIVRGRRYELLVNWRGYEAHAYTTVPNPFELLPTHPAAQTFNRDRDSVVFEWPSTEAAKRFALLASTPFGPFMLFSDSARLVVRGSMRNLFVEGFPYVFVPGFRQSISASAVDTNYFDYFRSFNNPFTGTGILNHVDGGIGVFGSVYPLDTLGVEVTADFDESFEGRYVGGVSGFDILDLYLGEDVGDGARFVSGRLLSESGRFGIVGFTKGDGKLSLAVLRGQYASDTLALFHAVAAGDSVVGAIGGEASAVYRRSSSATVAKAAALRTERIYARPQRSPPPRRSPRWHSAQTP
jgi:hypothetical protein